MTLLRPRPSSDLDQQPFPRNSHSQGKLTQKGVTQFARVEVCVPTNGPYNSIVDMTLVVTKVGVPRVSGQRLYIYSYLGKAQSLLQVDNSTRGDACMLLSEQSWE